MTEPTPPQYAYFPPTDTSLSAIIGHMDRQLLRADIVTLTRNQANVLRKLAVAAQEVQDIMGAAR